MKKIISSVIAIAMLSSTVAMAATVVAPTPQNETNTQIHTFDDDVTATTTQSDYGSGPNRVFRNIWFLDAIVPNPYAEGEETTTDKVLKIGRTQASDKNRVGSYIMYPDAELSEGDIFTISFDMAVTNKIEDDNLELKITINDSSSDKSVFKLFKSSWCNPSLTTGTTNNELSWPTADGGFTHYELVFDTGARTITYNCGSNSATRSLKDDVSISKINNFDLRPELYGGEGAEDTSAFYLDNMSFSVTRVIDEVPNEKVEGFDTFTDTDSSWKGSQTFGNAKLKYSFVSSPAKATNEKTVEGFTTENVLKIPSTGDGFGDGFGAQLVMPLDYTMDDDDVFTFKFDYAFSTTKENLLGFALEDYTQSTKKSMGVTFTPTNPNNDTYDYDLYEGNKVNYVTNSSTLFKISNGKIWIAGIWQSEGAVMSAGERHTITVVIDNSDDTVSGSPRTLAVYVDGVLQRNTKWIMTDTGTDASTSINGVSLLIPAYGGTDSYFDNLWASLTENAITVDGNDVSYTYPVVYDNETPAIFVKAYYDANNRLISADASASATPSDGRTVTTTLNKPEGTAKTKVFRWDSLDAIHHLSPAYDSSKVN